MAQDLKSDHHISFLPDPEDPVKPAVKQPAQYGSLVAWVFVINYVLGVGILGMPEAFHAAGVGLSTGLVIFITFLTVIATMWLVEVGARAQGLQNAGLLGLPNGETDPLNPNKTQIQEASDIEPLAFDAQGNVPNHGSYSNMPSSPYKTHYSVSTQDTGGPNFEITSNKFEINQLSNIFLGLPGKLFYELCIVAYMVGTLWSYSAVFASSMTAFVPIPGLSLHRDCNIYESGVDWTWDCQGTYLIFLGLYALIVLPLALLDLADQQWIQIVLCALRWIGLFVMYITVLISMFHAPYDNDPSVSGPPYFADKTLADTANFGVIFTTAVFSQLIQHSTPGLVQPIKNKRHLLYIFGGGLTATCFLYVILGVLCALYFGDHTNQAANLNWVIYQGRSFSHGGDANWFAKCVRTFVILFPVITVVSAFPLMALTLGNNIFFGLPGSWTDYGRSKTLKFAIRIGACIPPLIGACILKKLTIIIEFTGMSGFFVGFIIPGVLQYMAKRRTMSVWGEEGRNTPYTTIFSHVVFVGAGVAFGVGALIFTIYELIRSAF